jgi:hypothetical protein
VARRSIRAGSGLGRKVHGKNEKIDLSLTMPDDKAENILSALRAYCHESSESFYTISRKMGVSYSSLSHWMLHGANRTAGSLKKIRTFIRKFGREYL